MLPVHPKFTPIPIGLNCFEHGEVTKTFIEENKDVTKKEDEVFVVNFSLSTSNTRAAVRQQFCEGALKTFSSCRAWQGLRKKEDVIPATELANLKLISTFMYIVSPRGNGESTHRTWQGLYLGTVPIVKRSSIDEALKGLPIHFVDDFSEITVDSVDDLRELYRTKYKPMFDDPEIQKRLHRGYYFNLIEEARVEALNEKGLSNVEEERVQCWGSN